jgi:hypothetical protein
MAPIAEAGRVAWYCGMIAHRLDTTGRPVCTLHGRTGDTGYAWSGDDEPYPQGTADTGLLGRWEFVYGPPRPAT